MRNDGTSGVRWRGHENRTVPHGGMIKRRDFLSLTAGVVLLAPESRGRTWDVLVDGYGPDEKRFESTTRLTVWCHLP